MSVISLGGGPHPNATIKPGSNGVTIYAEDGETVIGSGFPTHEEAQAYLDSYNAAFAVASHDPIPTP